MHSILSASEGDATFKLIIFAVMALFWVIGQIASKLNKKKAEPPVQLPDRPMPPPVILTPQQQQQQRPQDPRYIDPRFGDRRTADPVPVDPRPKVMQIPPRKKPKKNAAPPPMGQPVQAHTVMSGMEATRPATTVAPTLPSRGKGIRQTLSRNSLRQQLVMAEVLGKPLSLRDD